MQREKEDQEPQAEKEATVIITEQTQEELQIRREGEVKNNQYIQG